MLCNWSSISYVKSRAMGLNLVEYKSPVQNFIAYARIVCLLFNLSFYFLIENQQYRCVLTRNTEAVVLNLSNNPGLVVTGFQTTGP